ncbi:MAG TPA: hypothetical protein V6D17_06925 [Candidatus Obscuribacterales bacterium]
MKRLAFQTAILSAFTICLCPESIAQLPQKAPPPAQNTPAVAAQKGPAVAATAAVPAKGAAGGITNKAAAQWVQKPIDATYEVSSATGTIIYRCVLDGKGRQRHEMPTPRGRLITLVDLTTKSMVYIVEAQRVAMKMPCTPDPRLAVWDPKMAQNFKGKVKELGVRIIDGHPCQGWEAEANGMSVESWIATDIGALMFSTCHGAGFVSTTKLVNYSLAKPDPSNFSVPSGFKIMEMASSVPNYAGGSYAGGPPGGP